MGVVLRSLMMVITMALCLTSVANATQGTATFYTPPYVPSSCYGYQHNGVMIAAASDVIWGKRAACGRRYRVRCLGPTNKRGVPRPCKGGSVVVKIVDYCPPGCAGTIDLSKQAFAQIANSDAGKIQIEYTQKYNSQLLLYLSSTGFEALQDHGGLLAQRLTIMIDLGMSSALIRVETLPVKRAMSM
ncbi:EG45-like domain containing protein [Morella rubra]|uniref:EG45-like domain containing protein n=1 Tax=Morella rubra TaxID=262757 RepID=A0A6A1UV38_9ROSI|nr:EG45-like domain containing protein [Morella rubra]